MFTKSSTECNAQHVNYIYSYKFVEKSFVYHERNDVDKCPLSWLH